MHPLRPLLLWLSRRPAIGAWLERAPFTQRMVRRFVPGRTINDALSAADRLISEGFAVTLALLGEEVTREAEAEAALAEHLAMIAAVEAAGHSARVHIGVKPSLLGLGIDADLAARNLDRLLQRAEGTGLKVEIDMERAGTVEATLALYRQARRRSTAVGVALQASLRRSEADMEGLLREEILDVRLVKGAYADPPSVAFTTRAAIDAAYDRLMRRALTAGASDAPRFVAVATHDQRIVAALRSLTSRRAIAPKRWEVQMLYGVRPEMQRRLLREGYPVRISLPYGEHWYPYFTRRLAERPANVWFLLRQLISPS